MVVTIRMGSQDKYSAVLLGIKPSLDNGRRLRIVFLIVVELTIVIGHRPRTACCLT
jgi:hypothetical protein